MKPCLFLLVAALLIGSPSFAFFDQCNNGEECLIELPGSLCADGTQSYFTVTKREGAKNLLIYLSGGGACWNKSSCEKGYASPLTRVPPHNDYNQGSGIKDGSTEINPFSKDFQIVHIPYCTGDTYAGDRLINYGTEENPYKIYHHGYQNVVLALEAIKKEFPVPDKAALLGCSAGGVGVYYHLRNFAGTFDQSQRYVISDAGLPFKPPYIYPERYQKVMENWGAQNTLPHWPSNDQRVAHFGEVIEWNTATFPEVKFGFISSYRDSVMTFFSLAVGSPSPFTAVKETIIDVANHHIGKDKPNQKVFYLDDSTHCYTGMDLGKTKSMGTSLSTWMHAMLEDSDSWENIRPDLSYEVPSALEKPEEKRIKEILNGTPVF